jgi:hypothetical protein
MAPVVDTGFSQTSFVTRAGALILWRVFAITLLVPGLVSCASAQDWGNPTWSDEFNATVSGTPPDSSKWTFERAAMAGVTASWRFIVVQARLLRHRVTPAIQMHSRMAMEISSSGLYEPVRILLRLGPGLQPA